MDFVKNLDCLVCRLYDSNFVSDFS